MAKLNWNRAASASKRWAYNDIAYQPPKPKSAITRAREAVAICQADYDRARKSLKPLKLRRLLAAKAQMALAYRKDRALQ